MGVRVLAAVILTGIAINVFAIAPPQPRIAPGYNPVDQRTEQGIWMELADFERSIQRSALLVREGSINEYVKSVACRVADAYCADLRVYITRNPGFNASMTANGILQIWTGLLVRVSSEDELAAILGHELAHYTQLHTLERLERIKKSTATGSVFDLGLILLTGSSIPVGQLAAAASLMAFSREQEQEADLLGVDFMANSAYDPHAAVRVWQMLVEEDLKAVSKRREPGLFSKTHPSSTDRIDTLKAYVSNRDAPGKKDESHQDRHVDMLNHHYMMLMEDQIDTNRFGRTEAILDKHLKIGINPGLIDFFRGEMYRQRNEEGDLLRAAEAYQHAVEGDDPVAEAYLNLAYLQLKQRQKAEAAANFNRYLELRPDAEDRAMIEFYLEEIQP